MGASLAFQVILVYHFLKQKSTKLETNRSFFWLFSVGILNLLMGFAANFLLIQANPAWDQWTRRAMTALMILDVLFDQALLFYLHDQAVPKKWDRVWLWLPLLFFPAAMILFMLSNRDTGWFFTVSRGAYTIGPLYWLTNFNSALNLTAMVGFSIRHRKELGNSKLRAVCELTCITVITLIIRVVFSQSFTELLSGFSITMSVTVLFLTLNNPYHSLDGLTGAFDSHFFRNRVKARLDRNREFHLLAVELNQLKHINFVLGAESGSEFLILVARMLASCDKRDMVFRISGKRFLVMSPTWEGLELVRRQAMEFFSHPLRLGEETIDPHAVICTIPNAHEVGDSSELIAYGEYLARQARWPFETCLIESSEKTLEGFRYNQEVESFLDTAVQQDLFEVVFQPVFDIKQQRYTTMEALSRLHHPRLGPVSPGVFIDIAEKNDQIAKIAILQLRRICRFLDENRQLLQVFHSVKVNVSPIELMKPGHVESMLEIIRQFRLPTPFFQFEITESTAVEHGRSLDRIVAQFTEEGIGLCLDDFGSGYANLNTVMQLPFHTIKLDRSLLFGICQDEKVASLYKSLVVSLHNLGFHVLSEGVETGEELDLVSRWGVDMIQGFYFSRPLAGHVLMEDVVGVVC